MDVSIQVVGKDTAEIYRFVTEVIGKMPGVRKTTTSIVPIVLKDVYQWRIPRGAVLIKSSENSFENQRLIRMRSDENL